MSLYRLFFVVTFYRKELFMVNMSSNNTKENNRVTISNNQAKYYSDVALGYANQAKIYADSAKLVESNVDLLLDNANFETVAENIEKVNIVADNINNLEDLSTSWGNISGDISNQADLQTKLNEKVNTSDLANVAKTGSYNDLSDKPTIPDVSNLATKTELSAKANSSDLSTVATSGSYNDLSNKPTIPTLPSNITTQGNTFNGANQLVKLTADGKLPAIDGSLLTGIQSSGGGNIVLDDTVSQDSENGVKSSGIYNAIHTMFNLLFPVKEKVTFSSSVTLEFGKMKYGSVSSNLTFILPSNFSVSGYNITNNSPKRIYTQISLTSASLTINLGTTRYFNDTTPSFSKSGYYSIIHEYDENAAQWTVDVIYKGQDSDWGGGGDEGGFGRS